MPHNISLITTIAAALGFGLLFGFLATRLKLPERAGKVFIGERELAAGMARHVLEVFDSRREPAPH